VIQMAKKFTHGKIVWIGAGAAAIKDNPFFPE
jgi:hypothetical protein